MPHARTHARQSEQPRHSSAQRRKGRWSAWSSNVDSLGSACVVQPMPPSPRPPLAVDVQVGNRTEGGVLKA
ncbi:hypothetical protein CPAR01_13187 [Colletotrichum paranaense]|uniref:Uncharacterized protein n=1 Tax=Colletotrichum paranaense TaxID=1914294 RepID=A0ABQ9S593_9PEZI|nr:uncharacterized protein CPAR01_13187 [Colletotrichum paranaense]KAK1526659.1 hypothetical protein CPAR01_13187 [Colletotrichum paranaense]